MNSSRHLAMRLLACTLVAAMLSGCHSFDSGLADPSRTWVAPAAGRSPVSPILQSASAIDAAEEVLPNATPPTPEDLKVIEQDYVIGPTDILDIGILDLFMEGQETVLRREVSETGFIRLPQIPELVKATGCTRDELIGKLSGLYSPHILLNPMISVTVVARRQSTFSVLGPVGTPGTFNIFRPDTRLLEALALANDIREQPIHHIYVMRQPLVPHNPPTAAQAAPTSAPAETPVPEGMSKEQAERERALQEFQKALQQGGAPSEPDPAAPPTTEPDPAAPTPSAVRASAARPQPGKVLAKAPGNGASVAAARATVPISARPAGDKARSARPVQAPAVAKAPARLIDPAAPIHLTELAAEGRAPASEDGTSSQPRKLRWVYNNSDQKWVQVPADDPPHEQKPPPPATTSEEPAPAAPPTDTQAPQEPATQTATAESMPAEQQDSLPAQAQTATDAAAEQCPAPQTAPAEKAEPEIVIHEPPGPDPFGWRQAGKMEQSRLIAIDLKRLKSGDERMNIVIRDKDTILVPSVEMGEFYITGEVGRPGPYTLTGRRLTIKQGIIAAGDLSALAWPTNALLIRRLADNQEQMVPLDIGAIVRGEEPDMFLKPNDIIAVGSNPGAPFMAVFRNAFRMTYGFGFIWDRNFSDPAPPGLDSRRFTRW